MDARLGTEEASHPFSLARSSASYIGLALLNVLLNIVTLTLYRFWGRTAIRRRLWAETSLDGESFEYTGRGSELFKGFLIATFVVFLPFVVISGLAQAFLPPEQAALVLLPLYVAISLLFFAAIFLARRYQLSRTQWRGLRFSLDGSPWSFAGLSYAFAILRGLTLGWFEPAARQRLAKALWSKTRYGDEYFGFGVDVGDNLAGPTYKYFALGWFLCVPLAIATFAGFGFWISSLGLMEQAETADPRTTMYIGLFAIGAFASTALVFILAFFPYQAAAMRRTADLLSFGETHFRLRITTLGLLWLQVSNLLLIVVSLGFLFPMVQIRSWRFVAKNLEAVGPLSLRTVQQGADRGPRSGEGLADGLDVGGF
jgi:uncharacterized membrane protein YjgN (DUF898 family)